MNVCNRKRIIDTRYNITNTKMLISVTRLKEQAILVCVWGNFFFIVEKVMNVDQGTTEKKKLPEWIINVENTCYLYKISKVAHKQSKH